MTVKEMIFFKIKLSKADRIDAVISNIAEVKNYGSVVFYKIHDADDLKSIIETKNKIGKRVQIQINGKGAIIEYSEMSNEFGKPMISYSFHDNITMFLWKDPDGSNLFSCNTAGQVILENSNLICKSESGETTDIVKEHVYGFDNISIYY